MTETTPLAQFLRARREQLTPADVGLRDSGRRRTPGLRREEVATLAGVSIDYLVRLEQGRDTNPSPSVLAALAQALKLDHDEHRHLMGLAAFTATPELEQFCPGAPSLVPEVSPTVQALVDQLHPTPAFVVGALGDVVGSNPAWRAIAHPLGLLDHPNLAGHVFLDPRARAAYRDWHAAADAQVARLRTAHRQLEGTPEHAALMGELLAVDDFATRWAAHPVGVTRRGPLALVHPVVGELRFNHEALDVAEDGQQLVAWLPADEATTAAVRHVLATELPTSPAHLRVVGDG